MNIQSIAIASDLSERSDRAPQRGFLLARELGVRMTLASNVDDSVPESMAELLEKCHTHLEASAVRLVGDVVHEVFEIGDPIPRLVDIVISGGFHLAVVGRHRSRGAFRWVATNDFGDCGVPVKNIGVDGGIACAC